MAVVLKVVGVSKVRSQTVQQRTRESNAYLLGAGASVCHPKLYLISILPFRPFPLCGFDLHTPNRLESVRHGKRIVSMRRRQQMGAVSQEDHHNPKTWTGIGGVYAVKDHRAEARVRA